MTNEHDWAIDGDEDTRTISELVDYEEEDGEVETFYGTEEETYYVDRHGRGWLVQGPDMVSPVPVRAEVPATARGLDASILAGLDVPDCIGECEGHPAGPSDPMGQTVYCDGTCRC